MINKLRVTNLGPSKDIDVTFGSRLNLITGDNGLGKSFLLDLIWFAMTRQWPAEVNPHLMSGTVARPNKNNKSTIEAEIQGAKKVALVKSFFSLENDEWQFSSGQPASPGLVFYLMADGSFAVWDSERNRRHLKDNDEPVPAFVLTNKQVFNGLDGKGDSKLCNGLILDWSTWSDSKSYGYLADQMNAVLKALSPCGEEISAGIPERVGLSDSRRVPTIKTTYGESVPITLASSGIKKIVELAYMLVWSVNEHTEIVRLKGKSIDTRVTLLIDEVESHLHPRWQRSIIPALLAAIEELYRQRGSEVSTQIILTTHSPLVMSSIEGSFDEIQDKWFDLDLVKGLVSLTSREFLPMGSIENWLTSEAFDLQTSYSLKVEKVIQRANALLKKDRIKKSELLSIKRELAEVLPEMDPYWICWNGELQRRVSSQKR